MLSRDYGIMGSLDSSITLSLYQCIYNTLTEKKSRILGAQIVGRWRNILWWYIYGRNWFFLSVIIENNWIGLFCLEGERAKTKETIEIMGLNILLVDKIVFQEIALPDPWSPTQSGGGGAKLGMVGRGECWGGSCMGWGGDMVGAKMGRWGGHVMGVGGGCPVLDWV